MRNYFLTYSVFTIQDVFSTLPLKCLEGCRFNGCIIAQRERQHTVHSSQCLDLDLNGLLTRRNFGCIPGMLGTYTIPK